MMMSMAVLRTLSVSNQVQVGITGWHRGAIEGEEENLLPIGREVAMRRVVVGHHVVHAVLHVELTILLLLLLLLLLLIREGEAHVEIETHAIRWLLLLLHVWRGEGL